MPPGHREGLGDQTVGVLETAFDRREDRAGRAIGPLLDRLPQLGGEPAERLDLDVDAGTVAEEPIAVHSVLVSGVEVLLVPGPLGELDQLAGDLQPAVGRVWPVGAIEVGLERDPTRGRVGDPVCDRERLLREGAPPVSTGIVGRAPDRNANSRTRIASSPAAAASPRSRSGTSAGSVLARAHAILPPSPSAAWASWSGRPPCSAIAAARRNASLARNRRPPG